MEGGEVGRSQMGKREELGRTGIVGLVCFSPLVYSLDTTLSDILDSRLYAAHMTCPSLPGQFMIAGFNGYGQPPFMAIVFYSRAVFILNSFLNLALLYWHGQDLRLCSVLGPVKPIEGGDWSNTNMLKCSNAQMSDQNTSWSRYMQPFPGLVMP